MQEPVIEVPLDNDNMSAEELVKRLQKFSKLAKKKVVRPNKIGTKAKAKKKRKAARKARKK